MTPLGAGTEGHDTDSDDGRDDMGDDGMDDMSPRPLPLDDLDADQRRLLVKIATGPRSGTLASRVEVPGGWALPGPFGPMLLAPPVGDRLQALGEVLRFGGGLDDGVRELAIVATASACGSAYELAQHVPLARAAGVPDGELEAAARGADPSDPLLAAVARCCSSLVGGRTVDHASLDLLESALGAPGLFELVVLCGYYRLLATVLSVYGID